MTPIPYQPLPVDTVPNCTLPEYGWIQNIELSDLTQIQFTVAACPSFQNLLLNPTFVSTSANWNPSGTWDFSGNKACSAVGSNDYIQQNITLPNGYVLQLVIDVELFAGVVAFSTNLGLVGLITTTGESTFTFQSNGVTNVNFFINSSSSACLRNIRLKAINTRYRTDLQTVDGVTVATDIAVDYRITRNYLTISADWNDIAAAEGCYRLAIFDPCVCSQFGFIGDDFVIGGGATSTQIKRTAGEGGVVAGEIVAINTTGGISQAQFRMYNVICPNVAYRFTYTLTGLNVGDEFQLRAGNVSGVARTADGNYTDVLTSTHSGGLPNDLRWIFDFPADNLTGVTITNFTMEAVNPTPTYYTVPFKLIADGSCTTIFNACGDRDQFNMGFPDTGFSPKIRLEGTFRGNGYAGERNGYEFSTGRKVVTHLRTRKLREFVFMAPEYVHDFMQLIRGFDNVYINGDAAYSEDDEYPSMSIEADMDMAAVTMKFSSRTELTENVRTSSTTLGGCSVKGTNLLTTNGNRVQNTFPVVGTKQPLNVG
jgi:hypothetical protein